MTKVPMKGNEAIGEAAIRAGCVHFFGYPITPQTEIPEYLVRRLPEVGGTFVQAESEVASIHMVYGAAGAGVKCMTSSSSPGINLKLKAKCDLIARNEVTFDLTGDDEPHDVLVVAFGTTARVCRTAIDELRGQGLRAALFRPITLSPYPHQALRRAMDRLPPGGRVLVDEMSMGQMIDDVKIAGEGTRRIEFLGRCGGIVPSPDEVAAEIARMIGETAATAGA